MQILNGRDRVAANPETFEALSAGKDAAYNGSRPLLDASTYNLLLNHWNWAYSPPYIHKSQQTYELLDAGVQVYPTRAVRLSHFEHKTRLFSTFTNHHGNSSISFRHPATGYKDFGFIRDVWSQSLQGQRKIFVIVEPHVGLVPVDFGKTPYGTRPRFQCFLVIEMSHIISHVPYLPRPAGTFGIDQAVTVLLPEHPTQSRMSTNAKLATDEEGICLTLLGFEVNPRLKPVDGQGRLREKYEGY
ncbi:hypothetical protein R3P38DRAFT_3453467 [Favolaschia claudopus]|uniref:Uncharacterized protein n=1 Tax=Favolaschia claudopus TaxID=2862362 RepID=A0AAW0CRM7_9AGAR